MDRVDHEAHCLGKHAFGSTGISPSPADKSALLPVFTTVGATPITRGPVDYNFAEGDAVITKSCTGRVPRHSGATTTGSSRNSTVTKPHFSIKEKTVET